ncbi:MAG TPA: hypothetical protein VKT22_09860 [Steroidobacteraceae bacterium]|nr:hypothetical protein [Steroidobacteraceae bacterium]
MSGLRLLEALAWAAGIVLFAWLGFDAWRTSRSFDERLLLSSREGEIEKDLREVAADLEDIERRAGRSQ